MVKIKRIVFLVVCLVVVGVIYFNFEKITSKLNSFFNDKTVEIKDSNEYEKKMEFMFVKQTDSFDPHNYSDLINIFYTALNNGWDEFTFYCPKNYDDCIDDIAILSNDNDLLSYINDFIHPYNSYSTIKTLYDKTGEVTIKITHLYSDSEIKLIDKEIDNIIASNTTDDMSDIEKIRVLHDYIVNNTKYDSDRANNKKSDYDSARIQGVLYDHYAICSGYADTMAVILNKLNIPNYKISSAKHVWNAVYLDGEWLHLDVTFDDPVTTTGRDLLEHNYFLIDNMELEKQDLNSSSNVGNHKFDKNIYLEFAN